MNTSDDSSDKASPPPQMEYGGTISSATYRPFHDSTEAGTFIEKSSYAIDENTTARDIPVPPPKIRMSPNDEHYVESGLDSVTRMKDALAAGGFELKAGHRVLDMGCATGRMLRWLLDEARNGVEFWGVDIEAESIIWAQQHLSPPFNFATTTTHPHLPFPDSHFDLIYAGSVFTHISDLADAWLLEIKRLLKPGGQAYLTFNDDLSIEALKKYPEAYDATKFHGTVEELNLNFANVSVLSVDMNPYASVYYNSDHLSEKLSHWFILKSVNPEAFGWQTAYILEKTAD